MKYWENRNVKDLIHEEKIANQTIKKNGSEFVEGNQRLMSQFCNLCSLETQNRSSRMPRSRRKRLLRGLDLGHGAPSSGDPAVLDFVSTVYLVGVVDHELFVSVSTLLAVTKYAIEP